MAIVIVFMIDQLLSVWSTAAVSVARPSAQSARHARRDQTRTSQIDRGPGKFRSSWNVNKLISASEDDSTFSFGERASERERI